MIGLFEIEQMSRTEKLQAMELLWRSISTAPDKLEYARLGLASRKAALKIAHGFNCGFCAKNDIKSRRDGRTIRSKFCRAVGA